MKELCPFVVPVQEGLEPNFPFCKMRGKSIKAIHTSPTGLHKCEACPVEKMATQFCELDVERAEFDQVWGSQ
jgi:hypothetical protein